jgi:O-antigen/teichoic acid export membrane protein
MLLSPLLFWVVMPLVSRAQARSEEEGMAVFRRALEGIVVAIAPVTVLISAGSDILIRVAFGAKYAPAHVGLSILSLVFVMTYMNMLFSLHLIVQGMGWSVTTISVGSVFVTSALVVLLVPLGRRLLPEGGECAGAATSVILSEAIVLVAMVSRFRTFPLDARNIRAIGTSVAIGAAVLVLDKQIRGLGPARLAVDAVAYTVLAFGTGAVRVSDLGVVLRLIRHRGGDSMPAPAEGS